MSKSPWYHSMTVLLAAALLVPPLGLVLLWLRPGIGFFRKVLASLGIAILAGLHLYFFFGLRVELDGTGRYPIFSFYRPTNHYAALVESRAKWQAAAVPEETKEVEQVKTPEPASPASVQTEAPPAAEIAASVLSAARPYWTDFRGPRRDGRYQETKILTEWPAEGLRPLWKQPGGGGYSSFAVADGRAFTIEQRLRREVVTAYEIDTGRELWVYGWDAEFREAMGGDGPRATPTWDDGRLYALGATGNLVCLDAETGKRIWGLNILDDNHADNLSWGMAASPLISDEKIIVLPGGRSGKSVVAYHKRTGQPIWKSLDDQQAYTSPMLVSLAGQRQILVVSAQRAMGLRVEDGSLLWDYPWVTEYGINAAQPIVLDDSRFLISAGYGHGAAVVEVVRADGGYRARTVWQNLNMKNKFNSSVLHQGHIYGLDEGILACVDAATGQRRWKGGRYGYGQVLLADGHLILLTETGDLVLLEATPSEHRELARFSALSGKTWNNPALANGRLLVRNTTEMACFDLSR